MKRNLALVLAAILAANCFPTRADVVSVQETAPSVEGAPLSAFDIASVAPSKPSRLAMYYVVPTDPSAEITPAKGLSVPVVASAGTGRDTQLGVDIAAASALAEREGWPWYAWAGVAVGTVIVIGLTAWAIVEASNDGSHDQDSSTHYTIYGDDGSTQTIYIDSPSTSNTRTGY